MMQLKAGTKLSLLALILGLILDSTAPAQGIVCPPCGNADVVQGDPPQVTLHLDGKCPWDWISLDLPYLSNGDNSADDVSANSRDAAIQAAIYAEVSDPNGGKLKASNFDNSGIMYVYSDRIRTCVCNSIPLVFATLTFHIKMEANLKPNVVSNSYAQIEGNSTFTALHSKVRVHQEARVNMSPASGTTSMVSASVGYRGVSLGFSGGGYSFAKNPAPFDRQFIAPLAIGSAPGGIEVVVGQSFTSAQVQLEHSERGKKGSSLFEGNLDRFLCTWLLQARCSVCGTRDSVSRLIEY